AERAAGGLLGIDVDPLVVTGGVGERVDLFLRHGVPVAVPDVLTHAAAQLIQRLEDPHDMSLLSAHTVSFSSGSRQRSDTPFDRDMLRLFTVVVWGSETCFPHRRTWSPSRA